MQNGKVQPSHVSIYVSRAVFPKFSLLVDPFWLRKITTDPHILPHVNIDCTDDRYPKLKIYISEIIYDNCVRVVHFATSKNLVVKITIQRLRYKEL
jgi:hypothetical protein